MAQKSSPYGFQPISDMAGTPRSFRVPNGIASGMAQSIWKFQPVVISPSTGTLVPVMAITDQVFGIMAGCQFTPTNGRPTVSPYWPAGTTYRPGYEMFVYLWSVWTPGSRFRVQADGSVPQASMAAQFDGSNFLAGTQPVGLSAATVVAQAVPEGTRGQWALTEFDTAVGDAIGDPFTDLLVICTDPQIGYLQQPSIPPTGPFTLDLSRLNVGILA